MAFQSEYREIKFAYPLYFPLAEKRLIEMLGKMKIIAKYSFLSYPIIGARKPSVAIVDN